MTEPRREDSVLITDAQMSYEEELAVRKRRYKITMGLRFPCLILAGIFYQIPWLAVTLLIISVPLPWMAVLIANDRLPKKSETVNRYQREHRAIESRSHQVISPSDDDEPAGDPPPSAPGGHGTGTTGDADPAGAAGRRDAAGPG